MAWKKLKRAGGDEIILKDKGKKGSTDYKAKRDKNNQISKKKKWHRHVLKFTLPIYSYLSLHFLFPLFWDTEIFQFLINPILGIEKASQNDFRALSKLVKEFSWQSSPYCLASSFADARLHVLFIKLCLVGAVNHSTSIKTGGGVFGSAYGNLRKCPICPSWEQSTPL